MNKIRFQWLVLRALFWLIVKNGGTDNMRISTDLRKQIEKLESDYPHICKSEEK